MNEVSLTATRGSLGQLSQLRPAHGLIVSIVVDGPRAFRGANSMKPPLPPLTEAMPMADETLTLKSRKRKPPTGMELTVTISMPADHTIKQSANALVKFFEAAGDFAEAAGGVWVRINGAGIPSELEEKLAEAFDNCRVSVEGPSLRIVVNNDRVTGGDHG